MPDDITSAEMLRMHAQNQERMRRLEDCTEANNRALTELKEIVGRIDERTKRTEKDGEEVEAVKQELGDVKSDVDRAKGAIGFGMFILGMVEAVHALWSFLHAGGH